MVNYQNGKVYKIEPICDHEENEIYIGSTTKTYLSQRMDTHRNKFRQWQAGKYRKVMVFDIFEKYGANNCQIVLLETIKAETKDELLAREKYYTKILKCLNKHNPLRTLEEKLDQRKDINAKYQKTHKDYLNEVIICKCGSKHTNKVTYKHLRTKKHQNYEANNPINPEIPIDV